MLLQNEFSEINDARRHEQLFRGDEFINRCAQLRVTICGVGALGSNLVESLARQGFQSLRVIDHDRVEEHNVGTQVYTLNNVGAWKVEVLRSHLFRIAEVDIDARRVELSERTVRKCLRDSDVVIDAFDNSKSRRLVKTFCNEHSIACLHIGLANGYGEAIWNDRYRVRGNVDGDICNYPLARNLVTLTVAVGAEILSRWIESGTQDDASITLSDFAIKPLESSSL
ncbi:MAG: thiamine biosynthesis protein ThiF [Planctomycetaceae bacterium]|nr:thiamine biosynthesis protein ThiF [Planctomycetaceae bacterium]